MAGWGLADRRGAQSHAQGAAQKKNMPGRETDRRTGRRGGLAWSRPSNTFCHRETLLLATCWSHWPSCHRGHGSRQVGSIEDPAPAPAGLLGSLLCTESALSQKPEKRRSSHWEGRARAASETVPRPHGVSFTSVLTALETPPHPSLPRPLPGLAGRVPLLAEVTSCLSRSRPHSAHLFICSFVCELECGFLGSCGAPGSGPGSPKDAGPMSLPSAEALWVVGKTGVQTNRYR